jgi:hypothetical protein
MNGKVGIAVAIVHRRIAGDLELKLARLASKRGFTNEIECIPGA